MYLLDTNIWLERLLGQEKSDEVAIFLDRIPSNYLHITDFSFHSIGVIMDRLGKVDVFLNFINDIFVYGAVSIVRLDHEDMQRLAQVMERFKLDFDDAYQYIAAEKYAITLLSFDKDFDNTELGRKMPSEIV